MAKSAKNSRFRTLKDRSCSDATGIPCLRSWRNGVRYAAATFGGIGLGVATSSADDVWTSVEGAGVDCAGGTARLAGPSLICSTTWFLFCDLGVWSIISLPAARGVFVLGLSA